MCLFRYEAIELGDPENYIVEYRDKLYCFRDERCLDRFMRRPEDFWNLVLPHKLPPRPNPIPVASLPMLGYMEQTVVASIQKALAAVGNHKPKYPFLSASHSAQIYIAYHLKGEEQKGLYHYIE